MFRCYVELRSEGEVNKLVYATLYTKNLLTSLVAMTKMFSLKTTPKLFAAYKTLPNAQRTQGIKSLNFIEFFKPINESRSNFDLT